MTNYKVPNDECRNAGKGSHVDSWGSTSFGLRISTFIRHWVFGYLVIFPHRALLPILVVLAPIGSVWAQEGVDKPVFEKDVVPILKSYCWSCHGVGGRSAELDLRTLPLLLQGGKHGPAIVRGSADQSLLYQKLIEREMPPDEPVEDNVVYSPVKPTDAQIETIRRWIDTGAAAGYEGREFTKSESPPVTEADRSWWAFQPPVRPNIPVVRQQHRVRTSIDAFLLSELEKHDLGFSPDADRATLLRRASLDVVGLPPSPDAYQTFMSDNSPQAYEKLIDRLLESPHYGERWGRHWLDAAGYVDTIGVDNDAGIFPREAIWRYRDYVIKAFNEDKPFDRFLIEQLAGDELVDWRGASTFTPEILEPLVATGFLRQAADETNSEEVNTGDIRTQVLLDTIQMVSSNLLGLTLHCAQCHSHKYDPISQVDYFRFAALFAPAYNVQDWQHSEQRVLIDPQDKQEVDEHNTHVDGQIDEVKQHITAAHKPFQDKLFREKLNALPQAIREDLAAALRTAEHERSAVEAYLVEKLGATVSVTQEEIDPALDEPTRERIAALQKQIEQLGATKRSYEKIQALWDTAPPPPTYLYRRGDFQTPGPAVQPGVIKVLEDLHDPLEIPEPESPTSGYRLALARWLTKPDHPLTARVFVNRVWQHYFGRGIVETTDNFGTSGAVPTHPALLDWMAVEFVENDWSLKRLHKTILMSAVYRQASRVRSSELETASDDAPIPHSALPTAHSVDPDNRLLWRMPLRRLESEIIRDSMLATSGVLDPTQGGPPVPLDSKADGRVEIDVQKLATASSQYRRSVYIFARRNYHLTELNLFDQPTLSHNCTCRQPSAVVLQSLLMLNGPFAFDQAKHFAARIMTMAGSDRAKRIETAFVVALARKPTAEEVQLCQSLLAGQAERYHQQERMETQPASDAALVNLCQMLLNTNEFLYIH
jgi:hypothetical protein